MKTNYWLVLGAMLASSAIAQNNTNTLPEMPAPVATPAAEVSPSVPADTISVLAPNAPGKKAAPAKPKKVVAPKKIKEPSVALVPGPAQVTVSNLIVRGQAGLSGEVVTHLFKGDTVTVLSQINLEKHAAGEPAQWAKIASSTNTHTWVSARFIDPTNKTVLPKKLNLRAGPGENYSVLGVIERGASVDEIITKDGWMEIGTPASTYAFVAAMYLKQEAPAPVVAAVAPPTEIVPAPMSTPVPEAQPILTEPVNPPPVAISAPEPAVVDTNVPPPPPRVATHEGVVRHVGSLITPTEYELYDPTTDKNVDFLYTTTTNLVLSRYVGMRIIVTGEEGLAARWQDVPVLTIQRILVIDTNAVPQQIYRSPRAAGQRH
jgi:uncharacterized protein YgiM (DUF1202 family)